MVGVMDGIGFFSLFDCYYDTWFGLAIWFIVFSVSTWLIYA